MCPSTYLIFLAHCTHCTLQWYYQCLLLTSYFQLTLCQLPDVICLWHCLRMGICDFSLVLTSFAQENNLGKKVHGTPLIYTGERFN